MKQQGCGNNRCSCCQKQPCCCRNPYETTSNLKVSITTSSAIAFRGTFFYYIIDICNTGPDTAKNVKVTLNLPAGLLNPQGFTAGAWSTWNGNTTIPQINPGQTIQILAGGMVDNNATGSLTASPAITGPGLNVSFSGPAFVTVPVQGAGTTPPTPPAPPAPTPVSFAVSGTKHFTGDAYTTTPAFQFTLADAGPTTLQAENNGNSIVFPSLTYSQPGNYSYTITEAPTGPAGWTTDPSTQTVTVNVVNNNGTLVATQSSTPTFTNNYSTAPTAPTPATYAVTGVKSFTGPYNQNNLPAFNFNLTGPTGGTTTNNGSSITFPAITYPTAGTYTYTMTEAPTGPAGWTTDTSSPTVTVTVTNNNGVLQAVQSPTNPTFINTYAPSPTTYPITALKSVTGPYTGTLPTFDFTLTGPTGATTTNNDTGITFPGITYTAPGTYTYTVAESPTTIADWTADPTPQTVTVTVTDNNGVLTAVQAPTNPTFVNTYTAPAAPTGPIAAHYAITGTKSYTGPYTGATIPAFSFTLTGPTSASTTNNGTAIAFPAITYTTAGTYTYTVAESPATIADWTADPTPQTVTVTVANNSGTLVATQSPSNPTFVNTYTAPAPTCPTGPNPPIATSCPASETGAVFATGATQPPMASNYCTTGCSGIYTGCPSTAACTLNLPAPTGSCAACYTANPAPCNYTCPGTSVNAGCSGSPLPASETNNGSYFPTAAAIVMAAQIVDLVNQERACYGLNPVTLDPVLQSYAIWKAGNVAYNSDVLGLPFVVAGEPDTYAGQAFSHVAPANAAPGLTNGGYTLTKMNADGITTYGTSTPNGSDWNNTANPTTGLGWEENLASASPGMANACQFMYQWNSDCGHLGNMLNPNVTRIGVAVITTNNSVTVGGVSDGPQTIAAMELA